MIDISENIAAIQATATTDSDYTGKKIVELPDMVVNSASELKARFDAAVIDVLDPKYRENVQNVASALSSLTSKVNSELEAKSDSTHNHLLTSLTGTLSLEKGGTGATSAKAARQNLGAVSEEECEQKVGEHNSSASAHSVLFSAKSNVGHTHTVSQVTGAATQSEVDGLSTRVTALETGGGTGTGGTGATKLWEGTASKGDTITIPNVRSYVSFIVVLGDGYGGDNVYVYSGFSRGSGDCYIMGSEVRFSNVYVDSSTSLRKENYVARLSLSKWDTTETATVTYADYWVETTLNGSTTLSSPSTKKVVAIYALA